MDIKSSLDKLALSPGNTVVMGSGILNALGIRDSADLDFLVKPEEWARLASAGIFEKVHMHGQEVLKANGIEVSRGWNVLGRTFSYSDFANDSVLIDGVRYIPLEFLLKVKRDWADRGVAREKDKRDVGLMQEYLARSRSRHQVS